MTRPSVIRQDERGFYYWQGTVDVQYEFKTFRIVFAVCGSICALYIVMSLFLARDILWIMLLSSLGVMAVCGAVCGLFFLNAGKRRQSYSMSDTHVTFGGRRRNVAPFSFKSIRKAVVCPPRNMIELYQLMGSAPVFVPPEVFAFVRDYILQRIPETAEVIYENRQTEPRIIWP